jgi:hypothetical protein
MTPPHRGQIQAVCGPFFLREVHDQPIMPGHSNIGISSGRKLTVRKGFQRSAGMPFDETCSSLFSPRYFKVQSTEGKTYLLRYDEQEDEWTLQSGFDGDELFGRPSIELLTVDVRQRGKQNSKSNRANTVIQMMRRSRSIGS